MKAIVYDGFGGPEVVKLREVPEPALGARQIKIDVRASGVNRADLVQRRGHYPPPPGASDVPGLECAGTVLEAAPDARRFKKGDRVMALLAGGGYAERVCVDECLALPLPEALSFEQAAAVPEVFVTAHLNLFGLAGMGAGKAALIHAGASGVGTAAIQLVRAAGGVPFATAGNPGKAALCARLGAVAIDYKTESFADVVLAHDDGRGVDAILDPVGGPYLEEDLRCLAVDGTLVFIGTLAGREARLDVGRLLAKRHRVVGSTLRALPLERKAAAVEAFRAAFFDALAGAIIAPVLDRVYPAAQAAEAQRRMEANLNAGKLVLAWR